jgi:ABC-type uncharacterized transport system substrate-binding protein
MRQPILRAAIFLIGVLLSPLDSGVADKIPRVVYIAFGSAEMPGMVQSFREALLGLGYDEGRNIEVAYRAAEGRDDRLEAIVTEVAALPPDVIVAAGARIVKAMQDKTRAVPIVMAPVTDPIGAGFITSYARPGGNVTGLAFQDAELITKRLELLKELLPGLTRVTALYDPFTLAGPPLRALAAIKQAAQQLGIELEGNEVRRVEDLAPALAHAQQNSQAVVQMSAAFFSTHRQVLVEEAMRNRLPLSCEQPGFVALGCLVSYGPDFADFRRRAATYVDKILKGARPADLPVEQPTKFELVINLKTAKALGLTVPPSLLARADEVIE